MAGCERYGEFLFLKVADQLLIILNFNKKNDQNFIN